MQPFIHKYAGKKTLSEQDGTRRFSCKFFLSLVPSLASSLFLLSSLPPSVRSPFFFPFSSCSSSRPLPSFRWPASAEPAVSSDVYLVTDPGVCVLCVVMSLSICTSPSLRATDSSMLSEDKERKRGVSLADKLAVWEEVDVAVPSFKTKKEVFISIDSPSQVAMLMARRRRLLSLSVFCCFRTSLVLQSVLSSMRVCKSLSIHRRIFHIFHIRH